MSSLRIGQQLTLIQKPWEVISIEQCDSTHVAHQPTDWFTRWHQNGHDYSRYLKPPEIADFHTGDVVTEKYTKVRLVSREDNHVFELYLNFSITKEA